jgi:hypothetical protein
MLPTYDYATGYKIVQASIFTHKVKIKGLYFYLLSSLNQYVATFAMVEYIVRLLDIEDFTIDTVATRHQSHFY